MHWQNPPQTPYPRGYYGLGATQEELRTQARELYSRGQTAFGAQRYLDALEAFQAAYRTYTEPVVIVAIAVTLERIGRIAEARQKYSDYLRRDPIGPKAEQAREGLARTAPPEVPVAPTVPAGMRESPLPTASPGAPPAMPETYGGRGSVVGILVATGVGIAGLLGLGFWLSRPKKPKANRRRRRRR